MSRTMIWVLAWALPMLCSGALAQDKPATGAAAADASADPKYLEQSNAQRAQVQPGNNAPAAFVNGGWKAGDKTSWEQALRTRAQEGQNDYARTN